MIYATIALMTILIFAFIAAWFCIPLLRQYMETPKHTLLENSELLHGDSVQKS